MTYWLKKILVILPVLVLTVFFLHDHYASDYKHVSNKRLIFLGLTILLLYGWILIEVFYRKQSSVFNMVVQSSFYVYVFSVLTLTGFFILFREISVHDWWHKMELRVEKRTRVNFELFKMFRIYKMTSKQVLGNLIMLLPLGIYLPLLYKRTSSFFPVVIASMCISVTIELLQLVTSYRSTDIDDVLLNTTGAGAGFIIYLVTRTAGKQVSSISHITPSVS